MVSKTNVVGFVSASATLPSHTRSFNAFYVGAKAYNPQIAVRLAVVNTFLDVVVERNATEELVNTFKVDCIGSQVNDNTVNTVATRVRLV